MVAIGGYGIIHRAADMLRNQCNRYLAMVFQEPARAASLGPTSSIVYDNLEKTLPRVVPLPAKRPLTRVPSATHVPKGRKHGRVRRRGYNELARENSIASIPCAPKNAEHKNHHDPEKNPEDSTYEDQDDEFDKLRRESELHFKEISERVKAQAPERKEKMRKEKVRREKLRKMQESERRQEKETSDEWKSKRLAQLEREKRAAEDGLAREKIERKQSRLRGVFNEQQRREEAERRWKELREEEVKLAADREANLRREMAVLEEDLWAVDDAFQKARIERNHVEQEREEERAKRLRAEASLYRWKEKMKEYFPGEQQESQQPPPDQSQGKTQEQAQQLPSVEVQLQLHEKKWEILRSGVDMDGTEVHRIYFWQIPWPVVNKIPTDPSQISPEDIQQFVLHPLRNRPDVKGKRKTKRLRARDELLRWHSDKFHQIVLSKVYEEDRAAASQAAEEVAKVLTAMLA